MPVVLALIAGFALHPYAPPARADSTPPWPSRREDRTALPHIAPEDAGMSSERLSAIDGVVNRAIAAGGFPGAAVIVGREGSVVWERGYGALDWGGPRVDPERALYDVASLTKVVATTAATMVLVDRGRLRLDDPVGRYLQEYRRGAKAGVTIRDLLTHRSGLPAGRDLQWTGGPAAARAAVLGTPLSRPPGTFTEYSDLGPDVLGFVIERITGEPLDRFVARTVFRPLGMRDAQFRPSAAQRRRTAPTLSEGVPGTVHDASARALGGVAGHAGLFATAGDLSRFAAMMLDGGELHGARIARNSTIALFTRRSAGWRALGWNTCAGGGSCGRVLGPTAYGHDGFTGTSLWIDPERRIFVIVLTNWVRGRSGGSESPVAILHDVRGDVADLAAAAVVDAGPLSALPPSPLRSELQIGWWR